MAKSKKHSVTRLPTATKPRTRSFQLSKEHLLGLKNIGLQKTLLDVQLQQGMNQLTAERNAWAAEVCAKLPLGVRSDQLFDHYQVNLNTGEITSKPAAEAAPPPQASAELPPPQAEQTA